MAKKTLITKDAYFIVRSEESTSKGQQFKDLETAIAEAEKQVRLHPFRGGVFSNAHYVLKVVAISSDKPTISTEKLI